VSLIDVPDGRIVDIEPRGFAIMSLFSRPLAGRADAANGLYAPSSGTRRIRPTWRSSRIALQLPLCLLPALAATRSLGAAAAISGDVLEGLDQTLTGLTGGAQADHVSCALVQSVPCPDQ